MTHEQSPPHLIGKHDPRPLPESIRAAVGKVSHLDWPLFRSVVLRESMGFLTREQLAVMAADPAARLYLVLIRWHEGRALVPAQTAAALLDVTARAGWCVRDVSLPVDKDE